MDNDTWPETDHGPDDSNPYARGWQQEHGQVGTMGPNAVYRRALILPQRRAQALADWEKRRLIGKPGWEAYSRPDWVEAHLVSIP